MNADYQVEMQNGMAAIRSGNLRRAMKYLNRAVDLAESEFQLAEAFHSLASVNLRMNKTSQFFDNEKLAAVYWSHIDLGQAADFMKFAGDVLFRLDEKELANEAYCTAAKYFEKQASVERDEDLRLAWMGWSFLCKGKIPESNYRDFEEASKFFLDAAKLSKSDSLRKNREARARFACAMSKLFREESSVTEEIMLKAMKQMKEASEIEKENASYKTCVIIIDLIIFLKKTFRTEFINYDPKELSAKVTLLRQNLNQFAYANLFCEKLEKLAYEKESKALETRHLHRICFLLFDILKSIS
jgi:tetratricopeptide (TPR) repeat protein